MATQSLYRRYRPRRFSELKGQDHIVRALRTSVAEGREGQAYLFSGPRGTGKTTTARIMAKVLNCQNPQDGEPCCECDSCLAVEKGTSYDVHELDAASNNGVDAMRDLIEKASLGTPGRHKVYILDEVHMLSKGAEAALLKTLEEPPPHVVFVLATTDPQKMSDTIRSRTQHLQFHLLGADTLQEHVRWVAADAGLTVTDAAIEQVIAQGAGSPRDTLSALELVSNSGGAAVEVVALDEFAEAMIESDPGRALKLVAHAISLGRDPRTLTEELIAYFRNGFLALMAPELVQLPAQRMDALIDVARRAGAPALVRGIEHLGAALVDMRNAPDPRVLLDVATVHLTSESVATDVGALMVRIQKLERLVAEGVPAAAAPHAGAPSAAPVVEPAPVDPATGRRKLGSRAGAPAEPAPTGAPVAEAAPVPAAEPAPATVEPSPQPRPAVDAASVLNAEDWATIRAGFKGMVRARLAPAEFVTSTPGTVTIALPNEPHREKCLALVGDVEAAVAAHVGSPMSVEMVVGGGDPGAGGSGGGDSAPPAPRAPDGGGKSIQGGDPSAPTTASAPTPAVTSMGSMSGSLAHDVDAEQAPPAVHLSVVEPQPVEPQPVDPVTDVPMEAAVEATAPMERPVEQPAEGRALNGRAIAEQARANGPEPDPEALLQRAAEALPHDDEIDLDDLVDAPPDTVKTPVDRLAEAFPGSELVDDPY